MLKNIAALLPLLTLASPALAGFDWGADCSSGYGDFTQYIGMDEVVEIGGIPAGKGDVLIHLDALDDVDIQLIDDWTGTEIIAWPSGLLSGPSSECVDYAGATYCYSGYNGDQTPGGEGFEWIEVIGETNRPLTMAAYGYAAGSAFVDYSWNATPTCNEIGAGDFQQYIPSNDFITVGDIPAGKTNIVIDLDALYGADVDVQLWDGPVPLIAWPDGLLSGPDEQELLYDGMRIIYSGYNGVGGNWGHETIEIYGTLSYELTMVAYGYQAGTAEVLYDWGVGVGESCNTDWGCTEGLLCKDGDDFAGECHTPDWCESPASAMLDCADGYDVRWDAWTCVDFECVAL